MAGLTPQAILARVGVLALVFFFGTLFGMKVESAGWLKAQQKADQKHEQVVAKAQDQDVKQAAADQGQQAIIREIIREVPKIVDRPVYRNVCIDDAGVRSLQRAVDATNGGSAAGGPDGRAPENLLPADHR